MKQKQQPTWRISVATVHTMGWKMVGGKRGKVPFVVWPLNSVCVAGLKWGE